MCAEDRGSVAAALVLREHLKRADEAIGIVARARRDHDAELVELVWMPLSDAKQLDMPAVTGVMLEELDARIADGFAHELPVPFYSMPRGRFRRDML